MVGFIIIWIRDTCVGLFGAGRGRLHAQSASPLVYFFNSAVDFLIFLFLFFSFFLSSIVFGNVVTAPKETEIRAAPIPSRLLWRRLNSSKCESAARGSKSQLQLKM